MKEKVAQLLAKPMNRREFLRFSGASLLMVLGGGVIIQTLGLASRQKTTPTRTSGYGSVNYGGDHATTVGKN
jgi:hypothetical protein